MKTALKILFPFNLLFSLPSVAQETHSSSSFSSSSPILLNGTLLGRRCDGFGGLSGGGATSRLLPDYADPYRSEILDLLFKPFYGASVHTLKVEIGGDTFSGCGTEPSHMHNATDLSFERGYEWFLASGGRQRNPSLLGYGLAWGFPNWLGVGNNGQPLDAQQVNYTVNFCGGAQAATGGWRCDYVGIWNERPWTSGNPPGGYVLNLRNALNAAGMNYTHIVVADEGGWDPVQDILANATLASAISVIGVHYPVGSNSTPQAVSTGLSLWASEDSSTYFDAAGGGCLSRILNWNYVYGNMTALMIWNIISSYYDHLFWYGDSLMAASYPWSGNFADMSPLWSAAHLTQFAWPGWQYLPISTNMPQGYGGSGLLPGGGTYVTLVDSTGFSSETEKLAKREYEKCLQSMRKKSSSKKDMKMDNEEKNVPCNLVEIIKRMHLEHFATGDAYRQNLNPSTSFVASGGDNAQNHWTTVLETQTTSHSQCIRSNPSHAWSIEDEQNVTFVIGDGLVVPSSVIVWKSVFFTSDKEPSAFWFERQADVPVDQASNSFTISFLHPDTTLAITSMDRGQSHGTPSVPPPSNTVFPSSISSGKGPYVESFQSYPKEHMPAYFSDHCGSWAVMPRRDNQPGSAYEQVVVAQPIAWGGDSLYPLTIIGDWNATDADVSVDTYTYSEAAYSPTGDPLVSLLECNANDPSQLWSLTNESQSSFTLPGSLVDSQLNQCFDVFGCNTDPGTPVWMWPCVNSAPGTNCLSTNQLWTYQNSTGYIISKMTTGYCASAVPLGGDNQWTMTMYPCGNAPDPRALQSFDFNNNNNNSNMSVGLIAARDTNLCISSRPPAGNTDDSTHVGIGLRLGGMVPTSSVARAYATTWYNYGYYFSVRPDGSWTITKGVDAPGELTEEETKERRVKGGRNKMPVDIAPSNTVKNRNLSSSSSVSLRNGNDPRVILANGVLPSGSMGLQQWHTLRFAIKGSTLTAWFDSVELTKVNDNTYPVGWAGLSTGWHIAQFGNFSFATN